MKNSSESFKVFEQIIQIINFTFEITVHEIFDYITDSLIKLRT
jgi:hypothetical protein